MTIDRGTALCHLVQLELVAAAICGVLLALVNVSYAQSSQVVLTPSSTYDGFTPRYVGYHMGAPVDARALTWLEHSDVNAARVWLNASASSTPRSDPSYGPAPQNRDQFVAFRLALREEIDNSLLGSRGAADCSAPIGSASLPDEYVDWTKYFDYARDRISETFGTLTRMGANVLIQHTLGTSQFPLSGTRDDAASFDAGQTNQRWQLWRHIFALAYRYGLEWGVSRWQIYNEPNLNGGKLSKPDFMERQQLAADAVHMAVALVNARRARCGERPPLVVEMLAPNTAYDNGVVTRTGADGVISPLGFPTHTLSCPPELAQCTTYFCSAMPSIVLADAESNECWGAYAIVNRTASDFYGIGISEAGSYATLFDTYSFQRYGASAVLDMNDLWHYLDHFGSPMNMALTEMNIRYASSFLTTHHTMETPSEFLGLASLMMNDARAESPYEKDLYVFKERQSQYSQSIAKNGTHYTSADNSQIGGATLSAEAVRLFARGFKGARYRFPVSSTGDVDALASYDPRDHMGHVMSINQSGAPRTVTIDFSQWGVANRFVMVETVSPDARGEGNWNFVFGNQLVFPQPAQSVALVTVPLDANTWGILEPTADATIKNGGSNAYKNYGTNSFLLAANHPTNENARNMAFLKFHLPPELDRDNIQIVELAVWGQSRTTQGHVGTETIAHVYGIVDDSWMETGIRWSNAPNVVRSYRDITKIADNEVSGINVSAELLGHLTGHATEAWLGMDVTAFVKEHTGSDLTFVVTRELRYEARPDLDLPASDPIGDDDHRSLWMASRENSTKPHPSLVVIYKQ